MFGLKPAWQNESAEKRLRAVEKMDAADAENQVILLALANEDEDTEVRHTALHKLTDPSQVLQISNTHTNEETRHQAESVLHYLLGAKTTFSEDQFKQLLQKSPELKPAIAEFCPHATVRNSIIEPLSEFEQAEMVGKIDYTETRQAIAQRLTDIQALEHARKLLKGKDKSAEKIIKTKLDDHHAAQRQEQENLEATNTICEKMEYLASHDSIADFQAQFNLWSQRWESLDFTLNAELADRYVLARNKAEQDLAREIEINTAYENQQSLANVLKTYCQALATLAWQQLSDEKDKITDALNNANEQWPELVRVVAAEQTVKDSYSKSQNALLSLEALANIEFNESDADKQTINQLSKAIKTVSWPSDYPALQALDEAREKLLGLQTTQKNNNEDAAKKLDKLHKRINRLLGSTKRGDLAQAKRELTAVTKAAAHYTGKDKAALDERLQKAGDAVGKMADWKAFATEPKFIELCEAMDELTKSKAHPDALAAKISKLQQQWKSLGHSDSADKHWERFKTAADKAYEPCAAFFKVRHKEREQNLQKREPLVTQMSELLENTNWDESPDYKAVESTLRSITNQWQKIKDVERDAGQKQWDRLSSFKSKIYAKLDVVYDANIELKNQIIEQAKTLLDSDLTEDSFNKLKLIQTRWKQVGVTRRKQDQAAWKNFKKTTDAVYEKIQGVRKEKRAEEDQHLAGYRDITKKIQTLAKSKTNLNEADAMFDQLQVDYKALPPLPKGLPEKLIEGLGKDYKRACNNYSTARIRIKESEQQQALDALSKKATLCTELEKSTTPEDIDRLSNEINELKIPNNELNKRFEARLKSAQQIDRSEANQARQRLCLDLEILLDVESPAEDKALRMQIQLERMKNKGFGHNVTDKKTQLNDIKLEWLCLPGAEPELQAKLEQRFQKALKK